MLDMKLKVDEGDEREQNEAKVKQNSALKMENIHSMCWPNTNDATKHVSTLFFLPTSRHMGTEILATNERHQPLFKTVSICCWHANQTKVFVLYRNTII